MITKTSNHPNSRKVTVYRSGKFIQLAQGAEADDYFSQSNVSIGAYFESQHSQKVGSGLTFDEETLLLPTIIDTPADDKEFRKKVTEFYSDISTPVPFATGVTLEIGLLSDSEKQVSKDNMPISIMDYLRYRQIKGHPKVAESKDNATGNQMIDFYIFDKASVQTNRTKKNQKKDQAYKEYLKIKDDPDQVDQMLALLGIDVRIYLETRNEDERNDLKIEKLRSLAEEKSDDFVVAFEAGDLDTRAAIQNMVTTGVLKQIGKRYLDPEDDNKPLANDIEELVLLLKDPDNSQLVIVLKARLQESMKQPVAPDKRRTIVR